MMHAWGSPSASGGYERVCRKPAPRRTLHHRLLRALAAMLIMSWPAPASGEALQLSEADEWLPLATDGGSPDAADGHSRSRGATVHRTFSLAQASPDADDSGAGVRDEAVPEYAGTTGVHVAVGAHASTLGFGPSVAVPVTDFFVVTLSGNYFRFEQNDTFENVRYNVETELTSVGGTVDWHVFGGALFVSGGVFWNGNELELDATPAGPVVIGGMVFTPAQIGKISGDVEFDAVAPYVGIGFDNTHHSRGRLSVYASAGVLYQGKPDVDLSVTGSAAALPGFGAALDAEIDDIEGELEQLFQFYPVATLGLRWRF